MGVGTGRSNIAVAVPQALPLPPDVAKLGEVPGGILIPCTDSSKPAGGAQALYPLTFQGIRASVNRISLRLPVWMEELLNEKSSSENVVTTQYHTEKLAEEAALAEGGPLVLSEIHVTPKTVDQRLEIEEIENAYILEKAAFRVRKSEIVKRQWSVLPVTVTVVARIIGPEGTIWSQGFDVPLRFQKQAAGGGPGTGVLESYVDLTNGLPIDCEKRYSLELLIFVPTGVKTNTQLGLETVNEKTFAGTGGVVIYYDYETGPPSK